jgi:hypothetical protein
MNRELVVELIRPLDAGGYIIVWREPEATIRHNTYTTDPAAWIVGYREGKNLDQLQNH